VNAAFWNPAAISGIQSTEATFSYSSWFADLSYYSGAVGVRWNGVGIFALSVASLDYGSLAEAMASSPTGSADTRTGQTFTGGDLLLGLSFAREFTDHLAIGATVKLLQEDLFTYRVRVLAYDVGTNYDVGYKGMRIAMSAQNFGSSVKWLKESNREEGYNIPLVFRIGTSIDLVAPDGAGIVDMGTENKFTFMLDAIHTNDYGDRLHLGGEYWFSSFLALRGGYRFNYDEGNLSLGVGLRHDVAGFRMRLDYAYVKYDYLESPHRLSLTFEY
jgi:hypothetical protein